MPDTFDVVHPKSGERLPRPFLIAYGRARIAPAVVTGVLKDQAGRHVASGIPLKGRDAGRWYLLFKDLPNADAYTLEVRDPVSHKTLTVPGITVGGLESIAIDYPTADD